MKDFLHFLKNAKKKLFNKLKFPFFPGHNPLVKPGWGTGSEVLVSLHKNKTNNWGRTYALARMRVKAIDLIVISLVISSLIGITSPLSAKASSVNIWWPVNQAEVSGTQPFKAQVSGLDVSSYQMFWRVDNGQLNLMSDNAQDYPHKESAVDLSGWTWKGNGPYKVDFVAKNFQGQIIAQSSSYIYNSGFVAAQTNPPASPTPTSTLIQATFVSYTIVFVNLYPTINGNYIDCNGNIDNDSAHHVTSAGDTDPSHHVGQNCPSGSLVANFLAGQSGNPADPVSAPTSTPPIIPNPSSSTNPLTGVNFYRNLNSNSAQWIIANQSSDLLNAILMQKIASQPNAVWLGGWNTNVQSDVANVIKTAKSQGQVPIFIIYNIPDRDCGGFSAGGAQTAQDYQNWINNIVAGIGTNKSVVVLEPDGTALTDCLSTDQLQTRYSLLQYAVKSLKSSANTSVYIDAGHPNWISATDISNRLNQAGIAQADGFALNVSNFTATQDNISFGQAVSALTNGKHFIVDTSRNGSGSTSDNQWCNPSGRSLGSKPTTDTGNSLVDAFIWGKDPGGSDGNCNGGPSAGIFWPDYALGLASRTSW